LSLHRTGGHFPGHSVLHDSRRGHLFCGDSLKVDLGPDGEAAALSAHKAFHAQIPLSHGEIRYYRSVVEALDFGRVFTPFESAEVSTAEVLRLLDSLLAGPPSAAPVPMDQLRRTSA
jgi:glyoxylase-like metal-dependent hydrolase (beta-lactamase superfamily II)